MFSAFAETGNQTNNQPKDDTRSLVIATWVLAGGTIVIGIVTVITLIQTNRTHEKQIKITDQQNKMSALMENLKTLSDEEHRNARRVTYLAKKAYDLKKDVTVFQTRTYYKEVGIVASDFDHVGMLIKKGVIPEQEFMDLFADTVILCWEALKEYIESEQQKRQSTFYMNYLVWLSKQAETYWKNTRPNDPLPKLY